MYVYSLGRVFCGKYGKINLHAQLKTTRSEEEKKKKNSRSSLSFYEEFTTQICKERRTRSSRN